MFFASEFTKETDILPEFHTPSGNTIDSISFTVDKLKHKLKELNHCKSTGVDILHTRILKGLSVELSTTLSIVLTKLFIKGQLPQNWKDTIVTPFIKRVKKSLQVIIVQLV